MLIVKLVMMILDMVKTMMIMMILRNLIQKLLPADFSQEPDVAFKEDFNEGDLTGPAVDDHDQCDGNDHTDQLEVPFKEDFNEGGHKKQYKNDKQY